MSYIKNENKSFNQARRFKRLPNLQEKKEYLHKLKDSLILTEKIERI